MESIVSQVTRSLAVVLIPYAISQSVDFLVMALGFWYGSTLIASGEYTSTQFFVVFLAIVFGGQGAAQFFGYTTSITRAKVAANYMFWLRQLQPEIRETNENRDIGPSGDDGAVPIQATERFQGSPRNFAHNRARHQRRFRWTLWMWQEYRDIAPGPSLQPHVRSHHVQRH
jgi:ATP-binding cassette subfamily B (MDR/TAP) protein 1